MRIVILEEIRISRRQLIKIRSIEGAIEFFLSGQLN